MNGLRAFRPVRNGLQVQLDLFGRQGWHNDQFQFLAGAALFAAAGQSKTDVQSFTAKPILTVTCQ